MVEKKHLKEYMAQMVENLKADTSRCNQAISRNTKNSLYLDSLISELDVKPGTSYSFEPCALSPREFPESSTLR